MTIRLAWRIEKTCLAAWPALEEAQVGGWLLRFSQGLTRRANSANPLGPDVPAFDAAVAAIEAQYRRRGLPTIFRAPTLVDPAAERRLDELGYTAEGECVILFGGIDTLVREDTAELELSVQPTSEWLGAMGRLQRRSAEQNALYERIVSLLAVPAAFVGQRREGRLVALAFGALHDGLLCVESVITDQEERGRGHARRMLAGLFAWAERNGAEGICLQLEAQNDAARRLYSALGLEGELYRYHYRRAPRA